MNTCSFSSIILPGRPQLPLQTRTVTEGKLKIASYNCQDRKNCEPHIRGILTQVQTLALGETWLDKGEPQRLNSLHKDFVSFSVSAVDESQDLRRGRPYGGLSFIGHKSLSKYISVSASQDLRMLGLTYKDDRLSMLLVNVYLSTNGAETREERHMYLGQLARLPDKCRYAIFVL